VLDDTLVIQSVWGDMLDSADAASGQVHLDKGFFLRLLPPLVPFDDS